MRPDDLLAATDFTISTLRPVTDRDWSVAAGTLEWDVTFTVGHIAASTTKATTYLAARATRWSPLVMSQDARATSDQLLDAVDIAARALAFVAAHVDASARGFHAWGMSDASAFLARAGAEMLVHGWDVATGLGLSFEPPRHVCAPIVGRRFPWAANAEPWSTLLTAEGRHGEAHWIPVECPLEEWDGVRPAGGRPPAIAWERDAQTDQWIPTYP